MAVVVGNYELLERLSDADVRTHRARHQTLGQEVMLHLVEKSSPVRSRLLNQLSHLSANDRELFLDIAEHEGQTYLVSRPLPGFESLSSWMTQRVAQARGEASPGTPAQSPGEFTRVFGGGEEPPPESQRQPSDFSKWFNVRGNDPGPEAGPRGATTEISEIDPISRPAPEAPRRPQQERSSTVLSGPQSGNGSGPGFQPPHRSGLEGVTPVVFPPPQPEIPPRGDRPYQPSDFADPPPLKPLSGSVELPAHRQPLHDNSYTVVVSGREQLNPSSKVPKPAPPAPKTLPAREQTRTGKDTWYWVSLAALAVLAIAIVLFFSLTT